MEEELRVPRNVMKVVSVETRTDILKALERRQMTASELSRFLGKHVTTVIEHLEMLRGSNLVERVERPGRKWVYYKLTRYGKQILHPQPYKVVLVLVLSLFVLSYGLVSFSYQNFSALQSSRLIIPEVSQPIQKVGEGIPSQNFSVDLYLSLTLIAISSVGITYSVFRFWKRF